MKDSKPIYVTQPSLPPLDEFIPYLQKIWDHKILTNGGPFHQELEAALAKYLGVEHLALFSNGTIALITALQALGITGEVITTPYSFVATAHSVLWNGLTPVFVDVDPETLNLDPKKIAAAVTSKTTAILPVHCYGHPCDTTEIKKVAEQFKLKVIYDAAHAFGVQDDGGSVLRHGDLSVLSFHATKVFNTFEGGAIICPDAASKKRIDQLKNFGFTNETTVLQAGINGKMSEINAAFGMLQLRHVDEVLAQRKVIDKLYREMLSDMNGIRCLDDSGEVVANYSYFPILVEDNYGVSRDTLYDILKEKEIFARRYFYPLITDFPMYQNLPSASASNLPIATAAAKKVICLPIYPSLTPDQQRLIIETIREVAHGYA